MDILEKIRQYRIERGWTEYQLAEKSELPQSTISSWYRKNQLPTIPSLSKICRAFNITLSQFFTEDKTQIKSLTQDQADLIQNWNRLNENQQKAIINLMKTF